MSMQARLVAQAPFLGHLRDFAQIAKASLLYRRDVDKHILAAAIRLDEAVTLRRVEPLHRTHRHVACSPKTIASVRPAHWRWQAGLGHAISGWRDGSRVR